MTKLGNSQTLGLSAQTRQLRDSGKTHHELHQSLHGTQYSRKYQEQSSKINYIPRNLMSLKNQ